MRKNSRDAQIQDWEKLLKEVWKNGEELSGARPLVAALERAHMEAVCCRVLRDGLLNASREATRQLNETFATSRDAAIALRGFVKGVLGYRNEKLTRFGIKPQRRRAVRKKKLPVM